MELLLKNMLDKFDQGLKVIRSFYLYAQITPQAKQSTRMVAGKNGSIHAYTDKEKVRYMKKLDSLLSKQYKRAQIKGVIRLTIIYSFPWLKTSSPSLGWTLMSRQPDCDNLQKPVLDSLQGLVFANDSMIVELRSRKIRSNYISISIKVDEVTPNRAIDFTQSGKIEFKEYPEIREIYKNPIVSLVEDTKKVYGENDGISEPSHISEMRALLGKSRLTSGLTE